jgi:general secretion pathway protein K
MTNTAHGLAWASRETGASGQDGVALVIVLWMLALLAVIANSLVFSLRTEIQTAANHAASARTEAAADAGIHLAIRELSRPESDSLRWQGNGLAHEWKFGDVNVQVTISDESARIDLNTADASLLRNLFLSQGADQAAAASLVDAIADWRDPDDLRRLYGAERDEYLAAGKDYGPRNSDFETIEELGLVLGMNGDLLRRIAPVVTVYSGRAGIDGTVASRAALLAVPGATAESVDGYLAQRHALLTQKLPVPPPPFSPIAAAPKRGDTFSIQVLAVLGDNAAFFREAVVRLTRNPREPYVILAWRAPSGLRNSSAPNAVNHPDSRNG